MNVLLFARYVFYIVILYNIILYYIDIVYIEVGRFYGRGGIRCSMKVYIYLKLFLLFTNACKP